MDRSTPLLPTLRSAKPVCGTGFVADRQISGKYIYVANQGSTNLAGYSIGSGRIAYAADEFAVWYRTAAQFHRQRPQWKISVCRQPDRSSSPVLQPGRQYRDSDLGFDLLGSCDPDFHRTHPVVQRPRRGEHSAANRTVAQLGGTVLGRVNRRVGAAVGFAADECPCVGTELVPSVRPGVLANFPVWDIAFTTSALAATADVLYIHRHSACGRSRRRILDAICGNNFIVFKVEPRPGS